MTAFSCVFDSTQSDCDAALAAITGFLNTQNAFHPDIELGLAEAINNVVDHAYLSPGHVELDVCALQGVVHCVLSDRGRAYDPVTALPDVNRGHGWRMLKSLTQTCDLTRTHDRNQLILEFTLPT